MEVRVDGPYGEETARPKWANYEVLIIFAGGIGVRPLPDCTLCEGLRVPMSDFVSVWPPT